MSIFKNRSCHSVVGALLVALVLAYAPASVAGDDECCTSVGMVYQCWLKDAIADGVVPDTQSDCPSGNWQLTSDGLMHLCVCNGDGQCGSNGVCYFEDPADTAGLCGPSYCNGYQVCNCYAGCIDADDASPEESCDTLFGMLCCEGNYPKYPGDSSDVGYGFCSNSAMCGGGECESEAECTDYAANSCVVPLCMDGTCYYPANTTGECSTVPTSNGTGCCCNNNSDCPTTGGTAACLSSVQCDTNALSATYHQCIFTWNGTGAACATQPHANDACGTWSCDASHACVESTTPYIGNTCPPSGESNDTCEWWNCSSTGDGSCAYSYAAAGTACSATNTTCDHWNCSVHTTSGGDPYGGAECTHTIEGSTTACPPSGQSNTTCHGWTCDVSGGAGYCHEVTHPGDSCNTAHGGPGGADGACYTWTCQTDGSCVQSTLASQPSPCDPDGDVDNCDQHTCSGVNCSTLWYPVGTTCTPLGAISQCRNYACNGSQTCADSGPKYTRPTSSTNLENCTFTDSDDDINSTTTVVRDGDLACSVNDVSVYNPAGADRFDDCSLDDNYDAIYQLTETTQDGLWQLKHGKISVTAQNVTDPPGYSNLTSWSPYVYVQQTCGTGATQFTCNSSCTNDSDTGSGSWCSGTSPTVSSGPWPLEDSPNSSATSTNYISTATTHEVAVVVDSRPITEIGGEYRLVWTPENHSNNKCKNSASFVSSPILDGTAAWRERWRGNNTSYNNITVGATTVGAKLKTAGCYDAASAVSASDPGVAFFRVDLPTAATTMAGDQTSWPQTYKIYSDSYGVSQGRAAIAEWGTGALADYSTNCSTTALATLNSCSGASTDYPKELVINASSTWRQGWITVTNQSGGTQDVNYELNVLRVPRAFLGIVQIFAGDPSTVDFGSGCGCDGVTHGFTTTFNYGGKRFDFVPTNSEIAGYATVVSDPASLQNTWLVDPDNCTAPYTCIETSTTLCSGTAGGAGVEECYKVDYGASAKSMGFDFPLGGATYGRYCIDPAGRIDLKTNTETCGDNYYDEAPNVRKLTMDSIYAPAIAPLWGSLVPCWRTSGLQCLADDGWGNCLVYGWDPSSSSCASKSYAGSVKTKLIRFEGTTARVVTWQGFDRVVEPSADRASADTAINFQAIIRVDGRITYFYKASTSWNDLLGLSGWAVGVSGTRSAGSCAGGSPTPDRWCDTAFGQPAGTLSCDDESYQVDGMSAPFYTAGNYCVKQVNYGTASTTSGTWKGQ
jgi:hypothetical protein